MPGGDRNRRLAQNVVTPRSSSAPSRRAPPHSNPRTHHPPFTTSFTQNPHPRTPLASSSPTQSAWRPNKIGGFASSMLSINMRIFKTVLLVVALGQDALCLPVATESGAVVPTHSEVTEGVHYDQRQNGTENYRIHLDGVVFVIAPVEALLLAGAAGETDLPIPGSAISNKPGLVSKPKPDAEEPTKPAALPKSANRSGLRLANLLLPLLRRMHQE